MSNARPGWLSFTAIHWPALPPAGLRANERHRRVNGQTLPSIQRSRRRRQVQHLCLATPGNSPNKHTALALMVRHLEAGALPDAPGSGLQGNLLLMRSLGSRHWTTLIRHSTRHSSLPCSGTAPVPASRRQCPTASSHDRRWECQVMRGPPADLAAQIPSSSSLLHGTCYPGSAGGLPRPPPGQPPGGLPPPPPQQQHAQGRGGGWQGQGGRGGARRQPGRGAPAGRGRGRCGISDTTLHKLLRVEVQHTP